MAIGADTPEDIATRRKWGGRLEHLGHLYRYRSLQNFERVEELVLTSRLFFPTFPELNDPFDGRVMHDFRATPRVIQAFWEEHLREEGRVVDAKERARIQQFIEHRDDPTVHAGLREISQEETNKLGVVCLSEPPNDIPMWAYYADSQRGICLRWNVRALVAMQGTFSPLRVTYVKNYMKCSFYTDSRFRRTQSIVATKARAWKHEREWRIVREHGGEKYDFDPEALDGIIVGCRISASDEARVRDLVARRKPRIELFRAEPGDKAFKLKIVPA